MKDHISSYLKTLLPTNDKWVNNLEQYANENFVPIMDPVGMNFLMQIIRIQKPKYILEIGTAIGYSALRMNEAFPNSHIITIEHDKKRFNEALKNIDERNKTNKINVIHDDALVYMSELANHQEKFDVIFIDAAKSKYIQFFEMAIPLLNKGGIIITDNVLFKGYVFNDDEAHSRHKKLAKKIRDYNKWLSEHPHFYTSFIPIGDGIAISTKKA